MPHFIYIFLFAYVISKSAIRSDLALPQMETTSGLLVIAVAHASFVDEVCILFKD